MRSTDGEARAEAAPLLVSRGDAEENALDLEANVFRSRDPRRIAASLKRSAEASTRRKGTPYQSAMSMLTFYANRAGRNMGTGQRRVLERAKGELRKLFGREPAGRAKKRAVR